MVEFTKSKKQSLKTIDTDVETATEIDGGLGETLEQPKTPETKHKEPIKKTVMVLNKTNRVLEFDFGRDKGMRIYPKEKVTMDATYLNHPDVIRELGNIFIYQ